MTASVGEKRKRLDGKVLEEPLVFPCTAEELNHVLNKWIGDGIVRPLPCPGHQLRKKGRTPYFSRFIIMLSTPPRTTGPSVGSFIKS